MSLFPVHAAFRSPVVALNALQPMPPVLRREYQSAVSDRDDRSPVHTRPRRFWGKPGIFLRPTLFRQRRKQPFPFTNAQKPLPVPNDAIKVRVVPDCCFVHVTPSGDDTIVPARQLRCEPLRLKPQPADFRSCRIAERPCFAVRGCGSWRRCLQPQNNHPGNRQEHAWISGNGKREGPARRSVPLARYQ